MWREAYLETHVVSADPLQLICLMYEHAAEAVRDARRHLAARDIAARAKAISKTIGIVGELSSSLNHEAGGDISTNLEQLYAYMTVRLTEANIRQEDAPLAEVERLLVTLTQAWQEARALQEKSAAAQQQPVAPSVPAWQDATVDHAAHAWSA